MKTLKFHIPRKLMQSGHYWRYIWINYRPSALQRFHDTVPSWSEADALCGLPREQSALFIRAARGGEVRRRVRRGRGEQNTLDSRLNTKWKRFKHFVHQLPLVDVPHFSSLFVLVAAVCGLFSPVGFKRPRILSLQVILCSSLLTQQQQWTPKKSSV